MSEPKKVRIVKEVTAFNENNNEYFCVFLTYWKNSGRCEVSFTRKGYAPQSMVLVRDEVVAMKQAFNSLFEKE